MTLLSYCSSQQTEKIVEQKVIELTSTTLEQLNTNFQNIIYSMTYASNVLAMDSNFINSLYDEDLSELSEYDRYIKQQKIIDRLSGSLGMTLRYNCYASLIDSRGNFYTTWNTGDRDKKISEFLKSDWYIETLNKNGGILWIYPHQSYIPEDANSGRAFISQSRLIKGQNSTGIYAVLLLSLYIDEMEKVLSSNLDSNSEGMVIVNKSGQIILKTEFVESIGIEDLTWCTSDINSNANGSFTSRYKGDEMQIVFESLDSIGLKSLYITPYKQIQKEIISLQNRNMFITVCILIVSALASAFIAFTITKPLKLLARQMRKVRDGDLDVHVDVNTADEVGQLTENFNSMIVGIKSLMEKISKEEKEKKEAHLAALQAQINPHFLFNTLNAIKWTAYMNGAQNIGDMVADLGRLFEIVISKKSEFIMIREEIEYLKYYITLMGIRYNQQFSVVYNIDDNLLKLYTLKFVLQPIVENAIIHGLDQMSSEGRLSISGWIEEGAVVFEISDNGKGIPSERITLILSEDKNSDKRRFTSIGISNVNERIKLNFGDEYGLSIESAEYMGTTVKVRIPILNEDMKGE